MMYPRFRLDRMLVSVVGSSRRSLGKNDCLLLGFQAIARHCMLGTVDNPKYWDESKERRQGGKVELSKIGLLAPD